MKKLNLQLFGSRGASSGRGGSSNAGGGETASRSVSALEMAREDARQWNQAMADANRANAAVVEYVRIDGKTIRQYSNGVGWEDRPNSMANRYGTRSGTFHAEFQEPEDWRRRRR